MTAHILNEKKKSRVAGAKNITLPQLTNDGATLNVYDKGGNLIPGGLDVTKTTAAWTSSDPTVLTVTPSADTSSATVTSTGKAGTGVTVTATFTNLDGSPPMPAAISDGIDVPAGAPASATITLTPLTGP